MGNSHSHRNDTYELKLQFNSIQELEQSLESQGIKEMGI